MKKKVTSPEKQTKLAEIKHLIAVDRNDLDPAPVKQLAKSEVSLASLYAPMDERKFKFKTTEEVKSFNKIIEQQRAVRAIQMGLGIQKPGFNIYVAGMEGTGKTSVIKSFLQQTAKRSKTPDDWCYVHNFEKEDYPLAINLPAGQGKKFKKEMEHLVEQLTMDVQEAFQSEEYEGNVNAKMNYFSEQKNILYSKLEKLALNKGFSLKSSRMGIITVPMQKGKNLSEKEYKSLGEKERKNIERKRADLEPKVLKFAREIRALDHEMKRTIEELQIALGGYVIELAMESVFKLYKKNVRVTEYLQNVKDNILESLLEYLEEDEQPEPEAGPLPKASRPFMEFEVNVFVDNSKASGAPIVIENNPTYYNLFGKIEKKVEYGVYHADLANIHAGAIHRANGGYLVISANDIFKMPMVWETLKRMLRNRMAFIEDMGESYGIQPISGLSPATIPLEVKVILTGSDEIYHLLYMYDEDFKKIFKIKSEFDYRLKRNSSTINGYASFIATRCHLEGLKHFKPSGVSAIIEHSSKLVDSQKHLSSSFGEIKDIIIESNYMAEETKARYVDRDHVEKAIRERKNRSDLMSERICEHIMEDDIIITSKDSEVGQANGLAVYTLGDISFGKPSRITSKVFRGETGVINIEREAKMSGPSHTKGVLILSALIRSKFAVQQKLSLSATICFEQNYGGIDGDSASSTEYYTIVSAMSGIPLKQSIAVTGSVNQNGEIQPIGGVNEKIEGFFEICNLRGLTGTQGVIIPYQNVSNLMLAKTVRDAIKKKKFTIYAVRTVDQGLEILTGFKVGQLMKNGYYSPRSIYRCVQDNLTRMQSDDKT